MSSLIDRLREWVKAAGAKRERDSKRDGFLSYAAETHSVGYGLAIGFTAMLALAGHPQLFAVVLAALGGVTAKRRLGNDRVWREITDEPQYFGGGLVAGALSAIPALYVVAVVV